MKKLPIALGVVIVILLGILLFVNPAKGPTPATTGAITVSMPQSDAVIVSPVGIEGQAPGTWFSEAVFPVKVLDGDGAVLGQGTAQAVGDWMTTGTVPFSATIAFMTPKYATGTIVFTNDNPSGLAANIKSFSLPVKFR